MLTRLSRIQVEYVENNAEVQPLDVQYDSQWGLGQISYCEQHESSLTGPYQYHFASAAGGGVDVYIIDTGINTDHVDFEGRAS